MTQNVSFSSLHGQEPSSKVACSGAHTKRPLVSARLVMSISECVPPWYKAPRESRCGCTLFSQ